VYAARVDIEYEGTPFSGWARQPGAVTIEGAILDAFAQLQLEVEELICGGRTDTGVHALGQVLSVRYSGPIPPIQLARALNSALHPAIVATASADCSPTFDARRNARLREYEYRVLPSRVRSPLRRDRVMWHPRQLDLGLLQECASKTLGTHDFTAFTPTETQHNTFRRTIYRCEWQERDDEYVLTLSANAFLRHMVRVIVGTQLAVGRGELPISEYELLLLGAPRSQSGNTAPPQALTLMRIEYPHTG
jgi:tRNA pseudouridine38-40 synthase